LTWYFAAILALAGFMLLIVLHEAGHFTAAKLVGMRVEKFALFFGPPIWKKQVGETEYSIRTIPAGGYVKITGMNPSEELPDEVRTRAYYSQPVWKRIVVIAAGPAVNIVIGFVLLVLYVSVIGLHKGNEVGDVAKNLPAQGVLHPGDLLVAVDGHGGSVVKLSDQIGTHTCEQQPPPNRCPATTPAKLTIIRNGKRMNISMTPVWDASQKPPKMRLGFSYNFQGGPHEKLPFGQAIGRAGSAFWNITKQTASIPAKILDSKQRKQINGIVGSYETTRQTIIADAGDVILIMAIISMSLAIVNLFPFLPLDGGHIFWAVVEKIRRKPVPYSTMERSGIIGFALVLMLFAIGLTNDIGQLSNGGFKPR
jgi:regulator of sigma E protease